MIYKWCRRRGHAAIDVALVRQAAEDGRAGTKLLWRLFVGGYISPLDGVTPPRLAKLAIRVTVDCTLSRQRASRIIHGASRLVGDRIAG